MAIQTIALALTYLGGFPVVTTKDLHKGLWQSMTYMEPPLFSPPWKCPGYEGDL